jgi:predicted Rossmann-fold nucleotide-binding protein
MKHFSCAGYFWSNTRSLSWVIPGGYGTPDEFFEALTLIETHKGKNFPVIIFGTDYHKELQAHIKMMKANGTIGEDDTHLSL